MNFNEIITSEKNLVGKCEDLMLHLQDLRNSNDIEAIKEIYSHTKLYAQHPSIIKSVTLMTKNIESIHNEREKLKEHLLDMLSSC